MRFTAHQYQIAAASFLAEHPRSLLLADPGTGKTAITLMVLTELIRHNAIRLPVLLVAPLRVVLGVWPQEIAKWDQFRGVDYHVLYGKSRDVISSAAIQITNFDSLPALAADGRLRKYGTIIIDEVSKVRNPTGSRFKLIRDNTQGMHRRHGLTGSPRPRSLLDVWGPGYLTAGGAPLGRDYYAFRRKYFFDRNDLLAKWVDKTLGNGRCMLPEDHLVKIFRSDFPASDQTGVLRAYYRQKYISRKLRGGHIWPDWRPVEGAADEIYARLAPYCYRLDAEKCLDMPDKIINDIPVLIPSKYRKISAMTAAEILGDPLAHQNKRMISRRAAGGIDEDRVVLHDAKIRAFDDLVAELSGAPALVFFYFRAEGEILSQRYNAPLIYGGGDPEKALPVFEAWNRGELPLLFLQAASCGHGLNLQAGGRDVVFYSLTDNYDDYDQGIRRVWRQGVAGSVTVHRLIGAGTVDEAIKDSLDLDKGLGQKAFCDAILRIQEVSNGR